MSWCAQYAALIYEVRPSGKELCADTIKCKIQFYGSVIYHEGIREALEIIWILTAELPSGSVKNAWRVTLPTGNKRSISVMWESLIDLYRVLKTDVSQQG